MGIWDLAHYLIPNPHFKTNVKKVIPHSTFPFLNLKAYNLFKNIIFLLNILNVDIN